MTREEAIYILKAIQALICPNKESVLENNFSEAFDAAIEALSTEVVQGEWKFVDHEVFAGEYFCSICGKRAEVDLYGEWILSNYCPSCGARMENKE